MRQHSPEDSQEPASADPATHPPNLPDRSQMRPDEPPAGEKRRLEKIRISLQQVFNRQLPLQDETSYFILVNVLDIVMTNILLNRGAMESNPLANYIFMRWGFSAMIAFKMGLVAFICVLAQLIARRSMAHARFVLIAGTLIVGGVVVYSIMLGLNHR